MSALRAEASRQNGAKSSGPTSTEGKINSARNATRHGLNSNVVVLANESADEYADLLADFLSRHQPSGQAELDLVHEIAATRWRLRRIVRMESSVFDQQLQRMEENGTTEGEAFEDLMENSKALRMLGRYEARLRRSYEKAITELRCMQAIRTEHEAQNEPEPVPASVQSRQSLSYSPANPLPTAPIINDNPYIADPLAPGRASAAC